jgi:signal transduction histidine kinase
VAKAARGGGRAGGLSLRGTFLVIALVCTLPFLGLIGYFAFAQIGREKGRVQQQALSLARGLGGQLDAHMTARLEGLTALAEAIASGGAPAAEAQARRYRQTFPDFDQVLVLDPVGAVVAAAVALPEGRRPVLGDQEWFKRAATSTQPFVGEVRQVGPDLVLGLFAAARTLDAQFRGVVAADLNLRRIQEMLGRARGTGMALVVTEGGAVLARQPGPILVPSVQGLAGFADLQGRREAVAELAFDDGERRLAGAVPVRATGWLVVVGLPSAQVLADTQLFLGQVAGGAAVVTVLALILATMVGNRTASGLRRLRAAMGRLEGGDIPTNVPVTVGGEVGAMTEGFNQVLGWLRSKVREFEALSQVSEAAGAAISSDRSVAALLPDLLRRVVSGMGADAGVILIQEDAGLVARAAVGLGGVPAEGVTLRRGQGLAGAAVGGREAIVVEDVDNDYRVEESYVRAAGLRSMVAAPIVSGERVIGAVQVGYRNPHPFSGAEVQRLEAMARRTAQALEHERALEEVRRSTTGLEAKLAEQMEALQKAAVEKAEASRQVQEARRQTAELEQTIRMQIPQVREVVKADPAAEEAKRVRAGLQKTVSEELRVPLTALLDLPRFVLDGINKPLGQEAQQQLEILHTRGEEILELIDDLVILSALNAGQAKATKAAFSLPELVQRVVRGLQPRAAAKGNRIVVDVKAGVGTVVSDARRVERILGNLIRTALKYTELGEIRVSSYTKGTDVVLTVADDGAGFSTEEHARIFEPFLAVGPRGSRSLPGTGLMLTICERLVKLLGGKITVESEVDRGTWFTVTLPVQG